MNGGALIARVLERQGVRQVFTLCGGHISPILVEAKRRGMAVIDVRDEASAVFAADAVARLTGVPGVAAVTAGPGVTNAVTALKNAQMAESPLILLGGATATLLKGRGALQDIPQLPLMEPLCKEAVSVERVRDLVPTLERAFRVAREGVPGPVFIECPVDLLYDEELVRQWYSDKGGKGIKGRLLGLYLRRHARRLFAGAERQELAERIEVDPPEPERSAVTRAAKRLAKAKRPVLVVGSGALADPTAAHEVAAAVELLRLPVYLAGMARGLLGGDHPLQLRHQRTAALKEADCVVLAGFPIDFRLDYGRKIRGKATLIAAGRDQELLTRNRTPDVVVRGDAGRFLRRLAGAVTEGQPEAPRGGSVRSDWLEKLAERDREREAAIAATADEEAPPVNPLGLLRQIEEILPDDSFLVVDGGDFVASASYVVSPRRPLRWLDPGPFGTLGVGGGFALGAKLVHPETEVWLLYGDGSAAYSLAEIDTFLRHGLPVIAVVGNDAGWTQIAREQVEILEDDVAVTLRRTAYHLVAEGYGGKGFEITEPGQIREVLEAARAAHAEGHPVVINAQIGTTAFRKGSVSM